MDFEDLKRLYLKKREQLGPNTYRHISELLRDAKELHREDWLKHPTPGGDHECAEQSLYFPVGENPT
ncbi:MAG: hypothetical protein DDT33_00506 [Firmicutes bacterium]|nr:hypothetical protein [Bacillota bacterium]